MIGGLVTLLAFVSFVGVVIWAWSRHNRERFAQAAQLPLEDDSLPPCCRAAQQKQRQSDHGDAP